MDAESPDKGGAVTAAAFEFPFGDATPSSAAAVKIPRRIRRRLLEAKVGSPPSSVEEIEAKLKEANLRRQQFHEWLSSKARPKPRSPSWSSQEEDLGQRLEAKLYAAEQKRLSLLANAQMRLAKLDELRQAAKTGVEMRFERVREELGSRVESRVQQAEANRMRLLKDHMQRRAAAEERKARSLMQRMARENKYKECVRSAIFQKRVAAEKKRLRLLEEEKTRVHARVMQVHRAAKSVYNQRESERRRMKEQLESRLQRAKRQRAEYLRQRGGSHSSAQTIWNKHGDYLSRKLARCWRRFVRSRKTTFALAKSYESLEINEKIAKSMPFEHLVVRMESATTLQAVKALLERLENRFLLFQSSNSSSPENIDHLLKRLASPSKRTPPSRISRTARLTPKKGNKSSEANKPVRYPVRVVLCAYMILGHPNAVFSGQGERETALRESAAKFVQEFELLINIILDGRSTRQASPDYMSEDHHEDSAAQLPSFRRQLLAFDAAWRSYLYCFVVWKLKDARSLEDDLVRAACQLELSMMQTCKMTSEGETCDLTHDMRAIQKQVRIPKLIRLSRLGFPSGSYKFLLDQQVDLGIYPESDLQPPVTEDQKLLRDKVQHLSGSAGIERMESALSDTRSKFFEAKDNGTPVGPVAHILTPSTSTSSINQPLESASKKYAVENNGSKSVVRSLFGSESTVSPQVGTKSQGMVGAQSSNANGKQLPVGPVAHILTPSTSTSSINQPLESASKKYVVENNGSKSVVRSLFGSESTVSPQVGTKSQGMVGAQSSNANGKQLPTENELMVNEIVHGGQNTLVDNEEASIKAKVKETMEKAFWDEIMDSMKEDSSDYSRILSLVKEVRDELSGMAPQSWKQEILDSIDIDILSQLLKLGTQDINYLGRILQYALVMVQKLSSPAKEEEMKKSHENLLSELACFGQSDVEGKNSFVIAIIKGLRFILEETKDLKKEISNAKIQMLEPIIKGSAGLEYLQKAFADRYGSPHDAVNSLPQTAQWISSLGSSSEEEWSENNIDSASFSSTSHGVPLVTSLRTGGSVPLAQSSKPPHGSDNEELPECTGEKLDLLLRLGVLKLASGIEGLTKETAPETLELNVSRLRSVQNQLQQIIVISTSMLVLRQILLSENLATSPSELENTISHSTQSLSELLNNTSDVSIEDIINSFIVGSSLEAKLQSSKDMIARVLAKSLQSNDAVFTKVSRSIYLAARAVVLGGTGEKGQKLAEAALRRIGASMLLDRVVKATKVVLVVATVSGFVHGPWYRCFV